MLDFLVLRVALKKGDDLKLAAYEDKAIYQPLKKLKQMR